MTSQCNQISVNQCVHELGTPVTVAIQIPDPVILSLQFPPGIYMHKYTSYETRMSQNLT